MQRTFEVFKHPLQDPKAVKRGFSWPGLFFTWIWAFANRLWLIGGTLFILSVVGLLARQLLYQNPIVLFASLVLPLVVGLKGNSWRSKSLQNRGYDYAGALAASNSAAAIAKFKQFGGVIPDDLKVSAARTGFLSVPKGVQGLFAIGWLTWKAAFRFRLFLVLCLLLLGSVVGLPLLLKDDGTARGFTQILLTYTLSSITALLGLSTLWLACGTLARDIEECQIQMVAVKPIARWQIWLGKWLGIMLLNATLLAISGGSVYVLLLWRATKLPPPEQAILRNEILLARGSAREKSVDKEIDAQTDQALHELLQKNPGGQADTNEVRKQIREQVKAGYQVVPPAYPRQWKISLGSARNYLRNRPLQLRIKFNSADKSPSGTFAGIWRVGVPQKTMLWQSEPMSLAPDAFHEFPVPPNLFDEDGLLTVTFLNPNNTALLFPLEDGFEVLYREGGFGLNFMRGLAIIFCWMAALAALGLASASLLSFPVAAFFSLTVLVIALSSGTLAGAVEEGSIGNYNAEKGGHGSTPADWIIIPMFRGMLWLVNLAKEFSPIDSLSTGRSITWGQLGRAFGQIVLLLGGVMALVGIAIFTRRELATAQGTQ